MKNKNLIPSADLTSFMSGQPDSNNISKMNRIDRKGHKGAKLKRYNKNRQTNKTARLSRRGNR